MEQHYHNSIYNSDKKQNKFIDDDISIKAKNYFVSNKETSKIKI